MAVLKNALNNMKYRALKNATSLVFEHINCSLLNLHEYSEFTALNFYFMLLRHILQLVNQIQDVKARSALKHSIFSHPSLGHLRKDMLKDITSFKEILGGFPTDTDLTVSSFFCGMILCYVF